MRIVAAGQAKSGTTALYHALKQSLPEKYRFLFEPESYAPSGADRFVLAKILINPRTRIDDFDAFDRKILIVRDPRDNLVSRLLYSIYEQPFLMDDGKVRVFVERLEQKQRNPSSVSMMELLNILSGLSGQNMTERFARRFKAGLLFDPLRRGYFVYKYEIFIAGRFSALAEYLGFDVRFGGNVDAAYSRVARTKGAGDWKNWFTEPDVEFFSPLYGEYLARYGYEPDWTLNREPRIRPEHSTDYIKRLVDEGRAKLAAAGARKKRLSLFRARLERFKKAK
jgi:hypothetical protein